MNLANFQNYILGLCTMLLGYGLRSKNYKISGDIAILIGVSGIIFIFSSNLWSLIIAIIITLIFISLYIIGVYFPTTFHIKEKPFNTVTVLLWASGILVVIIFIFSSFITTNIFQKDKVKSIAQIDELVEFGNDMKISKIDKMRSGSVYVFQEMKELRNNAVLLLEAFGYKESYLYKEALNPPNVNPQLGPRALFARKNEFVDHYIAILKSLKSDIKPDT